MDRIEQRADFEYIRYANCWEDTEILYVALSPRQGKRILSIASAGDNSLALIAEGAEVIAVDISPAQLACVELKKEAIRQLDHKSCVAFFGIMPCEDRVKIYDFLRGHLSESARSFWNNNLELIHIGFIHTGKFEKYFQCFGKYVLSLIHSKKHINKLLAEKQKEERIRFYNKTWANWRWHLLFKIFFNKFLMGRIGRDPEFFRYVDIPVSENILKRAMYALTELETHNNPYLDYILTGNYTNCLPYYLMPENFKKIKNNIERLILYHGNVQDAAEQFGKKHFDGFNLSDIFEYLDKETCAAIYKDLLEKSNKGARFVYWNMLVPRRCPPELSKRIIYKDELSASLFARDKAFFYSNFIIEETK